MRTDEAALKLGYRKTYVAELIRAGKLQARKIGPRLWDVDPNSVEEYKAANRIIRTDPEAAGLIGALEADAVVVAGKHVTVAQMFWMLSRFFLNGIEPGSIFYTVMEFLPEGDGAKRGEEGNEAVDKLMFALRTLQLVHDENRQGFRGGSTVVACTPLGARVLRSLQSKGWRKI